MAIFTHSDSTHQGAKTDSNTTIITAGSTIKVEMSLACNLYVDGEFEGNSVVKHSSHSAPKVQIHKA